MLRIQKGCKKASDQDGGRPLCSCRSRARRYASAQTDAHRHRVPGGRERRRLSLRHRANGGRAGVSPIRGSSPGLADSRSIRQSRAQAPTAGQALLRARRDRGGHHSVQLRQACVVRHAPPPGAPGLRAPPPPGRAAFRLVPAATHTMLPPSRPCPCSCPCAAAADRGGRRRGCLGLAGAVGAHRCDRGRGGRDQLLPV